MKKYPQCTDRSWGFTGIPYEILTQTPHTGTIWPTCRLQVSTTFCFLFFSLVSFCLDHNQEQKSQLRQNHTMLNLQENLSMVNEILLTHKKNSLPYVWSHLIAISGTQRSAVCYYYMYRVSQKKENLFRENVTSQLQQTHPSNFRCLKAHLVDIKFV